MSVAGYEFAEAGEGGDSEQAVEEARQSGAQRAVVVAPGLVVVVYGACAWCHAQASGGIVEGVEEFVGVDRYAFYGLEAVFFPESCFKEEAGDVGHDCARQRSALAVEIGESRVEVYYFFIERMSGGCAYAESGGHSDAYVTFFKAHEGAGGCDVVHRADYLHVGVEVQASVLIEDFEAGVVADECVFTYGICLGGVGDGVDIEVILVPLHYLIVGEIFVP